MVKHLVPYRATGRFAPIVSDYVESLADLRDFYQYPPDRAGLEEAIRARAFDPGSRAVLCAAITRGYEGCDPHEAVRRNIELLARPGTLTVTTGHQLCLFTGPLYVPFKILNTVRLARELSTPERAVVPVFWMATEDHDRAEVDHTWVAGRKLTWPGDAGGAVGHMRLNGIDNVLAELEGLLGAGPFADELRAVLRSCYQERYTLAHATRLFVNALFGRFGVVVVDGDDRALKRLFVPIMQEELLNSVTERTVRYANERLVPKYDLQAHAREINLFHLRPGHRSRIERDGDTYRVLDGGPSFTLDELLMELEMHPERFSPNVLLRPLYQETVLPNIAYVGGGGELAYWLQLRWLFQGMRTPMPVLMLRTSAAFLSSKHERRWGFLGLGFGDLFAPRHEVEQRVATERASFSTSLSAERAEHARFYEALALRAKAADPTLEAAARAKEAFSAKGLDQLEHKLLRSAKRQQADALRQAGDVRDGVFPSGGLQERRDNVLPFYAAEGPGFFDRLLEMLDPLELRFSVLCEDPEGR